MRNLLIAATAAAAVSAMPARPADACGSYIPELQVMMLSSHHLLHTEGGERRRTFVILGGDAPEGLAWTRLAPGTYDGTQIASAPLLAEPAELTLVGPSGTRVVKLRKQVYLAAAWRWQQPTAALEVELGPRDDFQIALWGAQPTAWRALEDGAGTQHDVAWLAAQGVRVGTPERVWVQRIRGTEIAVVSAYPDDNSRMVTVLRSGETSLGRYDGTAAAALVQRGQRWLVLATHGAPPRTISLGRALGI